MWYEFKYQRLGFSHLSWGIFPRKKKKKAVVVNKVISVLKYKREQNSYNFNKIKP